MTIYSRKVEIIEGLAGVDFEPDGNKSAVLLYTADTEQLSKGKRHVITLNTKLRSYDRFMAISINNEIHKNAIVTGTTWIAPGDSGEIILNITPRVDMDLGSLDYIVKALVEGVV